MDILIAPDSFKNSLSAIKVAHAIKRGIEYISKNHTINILPLADGGEGTVESIMYAIAGTTETVLVCDPLLRTTKANVGFANDGKTAIIEMAAASGLEKLKPDELNPLTTSTFGTGELILKAMDKGVKKIIIGVGGSATNDAGIGMAEAIGVRFLDANRKFFSPRAEKIDKIIEINIDRIDPRIKDVDFIIASDVTNTLSGQYGASYVYGPQKGATPEMVEKLDANLKHFAQLVKEQFGIDLDSIPGTGAAGGLVASLFAFCQGKVESGFNIVAELTKLEEQVKNADLVITGEGKIDAQTLKGKTIGGLAKLCKEHRKKLIAVGGLVEPGIEKSLKDVQAIYPISETKIPLGESIKKAAFLLEETGTRIGLSLL